MSEEKKEKRRSLWEKSVRLLPKKNPSKSPSKPSVSRNKINTLRVSPSITPTGAEDEDTKEDMMLRKSAHKFKKTVEATKGGTKKTKGKGKDKDNSKDKEEEAEDSHVWDENLAQLEIAKKRQSVFQREMTRAGPTRHVTVLLPTPKYCSMIVRKRKKDLGNLQTFSVLKPALPDSQFEEMRYSGPRLDSNGQIVPHSILGEVSKFLEEATRRGQFKEIRESQSAALEVSDELPTPSFKPSPRIVENPKLNETKAIQTWDREMVERKREMKRLSNILHCPEKQLLMSKADDFVSVNSGRKLMALALENRNPDVCFWNLQHAEGHKQIRTTLTNQERGILPVPELSGDAANIKLNKGSLRDPHESSWFASSYLSDREEQTGGIITIFNKMLFDDIEVKGKSVVRQQQSADSPVAIDNPGCCSPGGDASSHLPDVDLDIKNVQKEESFAGPCLKIEDTVLKWAEGCCQGDKVVKTTYVLIDGLVDNLNSSFIYLKNCGTAVIRYHWKKSVEVKPIPIPRPRRQAAFYLDVDGGVILPGSTGKIEVKFKSQVPGCFSESWLLGTVPILASGGQIKFVLKGWARVKKDYNEERRLLQKMLEKREAVTLCSYLTNEIIGAITLKAYLNSIKLREEMDCFTEEDLFVKENPRLFFHAHLVTKLKMLYDSLTTEVTEHSAPSNDGILSIAQLSKIIHCLPDADVDTENDEDDNSVDRKELLLWQLNSDICLLSFPPHTPWVCTSHLRHIICYGLLRDVIKQCVDLAVGTAKCHGLVVKKKTESENDPVKPRDEVKGKTRGSKMKKNEEKEKDMKDSEVNQTDMKAAQCFSPAYEFRVQNKGDNSMIKLYDEKVYLMLYSMLGETVDKMVELFENL